MIENLNNLEQNVLKQGNHKPITEYGLQGESGLVGAAIMGLCSGKLIQRWVKGGRRERDEGIRAKDT